MSADRLEQVAAPLGRHFAAAGEAERAVHYFEVAGVHATRAFANEEAISSYRSALAIADEDDSGSEVMTQTAGRVWAKLAEVLWATWRLEEAREAFQAAIRLAGPGDVLQSAHLQALLGKLEGFDHRFDAALAAFDAAEELLGEHPWDKGDAWADVWLEVMLDGRARLHVTRREPELVLAVLTTARPVVEAQGSPARKWDFYWSLAYQRAIRNRWRVDEEDIANMRRGLAAANQGDDQKNIAYATSAVGMFLWMHGDLAEAREYLERSLAMAERIGQVFGRAESLWALTLVALDRHDVEALRSLAPQAMTAGEAVLGHPDMVGTAKACLAWLAWQDGRPQDVITLAGEALELWGSTSWRAYAISRVCIWPLIAVHLGVGQVAEAVAAGHQLLEPWQPRLTDELESLLGSACAAWDQDEPEVARAKMAEALELAKDLDRL